MLRLLLLQVTVPLRVASTAVPALLLVVPRLRTELPLLLIVCAVRVLERRLVCALNLIMAVVVHKLMSVRRIMPLQVLRRCPGWLAVAVMR